MTVLPIRGSGGFALHCRVCVHWSAGFFCSGLQGFLLRRKPCNLCSVYQVARAVAPSAPRRALDYLIGPELLQDVVHLALLEPSLLRDRRDGRPAASLVVRPIGQREQNQQLTTLVRRVVPNSCHHPYAHLASVFACPSMPSTRVSREAQLSPHPGE